MLTFALPWALGFFAAAGLVALFYFLRMRFRRQPVSSTFLWSVFVVPNDGGARLQWRSLALLALQLAAVTTLVLALAGLQAIATTPSRPGVLYIVDTSASMGADDGTTRLEKAKRAILEDRGTADTGVAVYADGRVVEGGLEAALGALRVGDGELVEARAAEVLGTWLQTSGASWTGVLVSDGGLDQGGARLARLFEGRWRTLPIADQASNLGLTDLRIEGNSGVRVTAFNSSAEPRPVGLSLTRDRVLVAEKDFVLVPGPSALLWVAPGLDPRKALWKVSLRGGDALATDDSFTLAVEAERPARVLHLGPPNPFLRAAFPGAVYQDRTNASTEGSWDLVVAENIVPEGWKGNLVAFGALPPGAPLFWGPVVSGPLSGSANAHPLSRWVPWDEVSVSEGRGLVVQPGAAVLAEAGGWPVAAAWEKDGAQNLVLGLDTGRSNLGLTAALPVLMNNLRRASVPQEGNSLAANLRVGRSALRAGSPAWHVVSSTARSGAAAMQAVRRGPLWELTPTETGTFAWEDGAESGLLAVQLPATESDLALRSPVAVAEASVPGSGLRSTAFPLNIWLSLAALLLLAAEWRLWNGSFRLSGHRGLALLRVSAAAAALLAMAGFSFPWPTTNRNVTLLFDSSPSLGPELVETERRAALSYLGNLAPDDRAALVAFGAEPRILSGLLRRDEARRALESANLATEGDHTDVAAALAAGAQLLTDQPGTSSQLLFTDGRTNRGGDLESFSSASRRFPVSAVPLGRASDGVTTSGLELPSEARPGESVLVRWQGWTETQRRVTLSLNVDGVETLTRTVELSPGANTADFRVSVGESGTRGIDVAVRDETGRDLPSAQASGLLAVGDKTSVLVIQGSGTALSEALVRQGLPVLKGGPDRLPVSADGYQGVSAVVLDNVPAPALTEPQQHQLKDWVASGGGLLVVGGTRSLGRGEYFTSALEDLLPVETDNRQRLQFTRSRLLFVVDHSGSMSEDVGSTTKLEAALSGIAQSLDDLSPQDEVGLLQFDTEATWVLNFTPVAQKQTILNSLNSFSQGGGTDLTKALDEVVQAFGHPGPVKRHVILMTDGQTGGEDQFFKEFTETMKAAQVTMTVLGIGNEVNEKLLGELAERSDGIYYRAVGSDIPTLLHKETVRVTRDLIQEGRFVPLATGSDPVLDLGGPPPPVLGYLVTKPKAMARMRWEAERQGGRDPLYADWRYGAGKVAVFTSDSGTKWLAPWSGRPEYNRFWGQAVRSLESRPRDKSLGMQLSVSASVARVVVEALDESGRLRTGASLTADHQGRSYPLAETAPGRYEADLPLDSTGLQIVSVADRTGSGRTSGWVWNPQGTEGARGGIDWAGLGRLTASTGGLLQPLAAPLPPPPAWAWAPLSLREWLLALALALFVAELGWRSTSLGQLKAARKLFAAWWTDQSRPWSRPLVQPVIRSEAEVEKRTREAYKYLATRKSRPPT